MGSGGVHAGGKRTTGAGPPGPLILAVTRPDRRRERGQFTHRQIVAAMVALVGESGTEPSADRLAERAGVTRRTLYNRFDGLDAIVVEAVTTVLTHPLHPYPTLPPRGPKHLRIRYFAHQLRAFYEETAPFQHLALVRAGHDDAMARLLAMEHRRNRQSLARSFTTELRHLGGNASPTVWELERATSWTSWANLTRIDGLPAGAAEGLMRDFINRLLQ